MSNRIHLTETQSVALIIISLAFLVLVIYWPVQNYEFINYDDPVYVTENYSIQKGITFESIRDTFNHVHTGHWHPLTMMSHMLDWQLFGDKAGGHHWTNIIIHIFNTILLFFLFRNLTGAVWRSAFVAALFAIHPINVESVAWVAERKNVLSTFFWMLTMLFYVWYVKQPNWKRYLPVFISFALGLMSKPILVTLPFVLLLIDYWPLNRIQIQSEGQLEIRTIIFEKSNKIFSLILEKIPLFILSVISCYLTVYASVYVKDIASFKSLPLLKRIANAVVSYVLYIKKFIWPVDLAVFYPLSDISIWQFSIALLFLVSVTVFICRYFRKYPYLFVGWFWYLGTLVPVIGLVQVGTQAMSDRYAYVSLIGIFIMVAWGLSEIAQKRFLKSISVIVSGVTLIGLFIITSYQIQYWKNTTKLFEQTLKITKTNYIADIGLGNELLKNNKIDEAISHFNASLIIKPENCNALIGLGRAFNMKGEQDKAIAIFRQALKSDPESIEAYNNLGLILFHNGHIDESIVEYQKGIVLDNENPLLHNNLGSALKIKGNIKEALAHFQEALRINPNLEAVQKNIENTQKNAIKNSSS